MTQRAALPAWYPAWARSLAELYYSGTTCLFVVHGNVHDLVRVETERGDEFCPLGDFLATHLFGAWDVVVQYDLGGGLRARAGADAKRLSNMMSYLTARLGSPETWPRDPDRALLAIERVLERNLLEDDNARHSVGVVCEHAQYLVPTGDLASLSRGGGAALVRLIGWAQNPYFKRVNTAICLVADRLAEVSDRLVQNPHVATCEVPLPDRDERRRFILSAAGGDLARLTAFSADELADLTNGLSLVNLDVVLSQARQGGPRVDADRFRQMKKSLIERQCQGLLEFVTPRHTLDLVVGQEAAKERLRSDAALLLSGRLEAAPMGYLISGPVGTGKTFLAECYAGSIGVPCVKLRNFRSKYVGETEANLQQILTVLRALGPVVVIIDEADAALGHRDAEGDSGTSSRVFSMIASQMGDTQYRGQIVWMLLTCRPDLLPIDLKRQGRAEVHIPLFYPQDEAETRAMLASMARKNGATLAGDALDGVAGAGHKLSGADLESVLLAARRAVLAGGRTDVAAADLRAALADFIPSIQGLEKELQELVAVLECTQMIFLPSEWRDVVSKPDGRSKLQERAVALRRLIED